MQESTFTELEKLFLALSDKTRLRLLGLMAHGEVPVGFLADKLGESQPKISRHLAYLRTAGLVSTRRDGKWVYYGIESMADPAVFRVLNATLKSISDDDISYGVGVHKADDAEGDIYAKTYMDEWAPAEMEIHLL